MDELTLSVVAHRMSTLEMRVGVMVILNGRLEALETVPLLQRNNTPTITPHPRWPVEFPHGPSL